MASRSPAKEASKVVIIADEDAAVGASTSSLLEQAGYTVVNHRGNDAILAGELAGACVLFDLRAPGADGWTLLKELGSREIMPPVLVLSGHGNIHDAVEAMKLGATDFLERPYLPESLLAAVGHALDAGPKRKAATIDRNAAARIASLSRRQREVLQGILKDKGNKIIAHEIGLSVRTVEAYRAQLLAKLRVRGAAGAVRLAMAAGML